MAAKSGSRRGLLKARSEDNASSSHFDAEEGDSDSEEEEDATKPGARHFGLWVIAALLCAILAMFCAVYGLSLKDSGTSGEDAGEGSGMRPEDEDTEHMPESGLLTNAEFRWFKWTPLKRTAEESILDAFRFGMGWANARFTEGREGPAQAMTKEYVADWVANQLLRVNPFGKDDAVPVPLSPLKQGHFVGYTRRQVCYIVAQSLLGARTEGYDSFLARYLDGEDECGADSAEPSPRTDSFGRALWNLLATCAADPSLSGVGHGPLLLVVVAEKVEEKVTKLKQIASYAPLEGAGLRVCRYDDGATDLADPIYSKGEEDVPQEGCIPPTLGGPGRDFLTGGLRYQAVLATAFGESLPCGSRSERDPLLAYMPEAAALLLFLSDGDRGPMSDKPFWLLGARKIMVGLDGTGRFDSRMELDTNLSMNSDLETVILNGTNYKMSSSRPLLAYIGASLDFLNISGRDEEDKAMEMSLARRNSNVKQRDEQNFDKVVQTWYNAMALTSYPEKVRPAMRTLVHSLGTGPWLSSLDWGGDSQLGMLAMWIAHSMAAQTWSEGQDEAQDCADEPCLPLDYYIYSDFRENPGNQCLVHAEESCEMCLATCVKQGPRGPDFYMPDYAYMAPNETCVLREPGDCGKKSFKDVMITYTKHLASSLWDQVQAAMKEDPSANRSIFDLLLLYNMDE